MPKLNYLINNSIPLFFKGKKKTTIIKQWKIKVMEQNLIK